MICPTCSRVTSNTRTYFKDNQLITVCPDDSCGNYKTIKAPPHMTSQHKQKIEWQRNRYGQDLLQPWEVKPGESKRGWQVNKDFVKAHATDPQVLSQYSKEDLQKSGLVTQEVINKSQKKAPTKKIHRG